MHGGPSGFQNASVSRTIVIISGLLTVLLGVRGRSLRLGLTYQDIIQKFQPWQLFSSAFAFSSTPELIFGIYLLYYFRIFERQIGSNKYSVFLTFSVITSFLLEVLAVFGLKGHIAKLASGPYGLIFASFVPFYLDVPISSRFNIRGLHLTDKSFIYIAGLQLLLSAGRQSFVPGICGILSGLLYRSNVFGIRRIKFPQTVASFFSWLSWSPAPSPSHSAPSRGVSQNIPPVIRQTQGNNNNQHPVTRAAAPQPPPESSVATLVSMGFDSNSARQALVQARNDINVATNILLEAQSH